MGRIKTLDFSKGIALTVIVILHAMFCQSAEGSTGVSSNAVMDFLYGGLYLFFIVSGYIYRPGSSSGKAIKRRIIQLTLVSSALLLILPAILYAYYVVIGIPVTFTDYTDCLILLIGGDNVFQPCLTDFSRYPICGAATGYYYIQIMMVAFLIFYPIVDKAIETGKRTAITVLLLLIVSFVLIGIVNMKLPFYAQLAPIATAFMIIGAYAKKTDLMDFIDNSWHSRRYWVLFIGALAVAAVMMCFFPTGHAFDWNYFGEYGAYSIFPFFIAYTSSCYVLIVAFSFLARIPVLGTAICYCGKHTLALVLFHSFFIKLVASPIYGVSTFSWFPVMPAGFSIMAGLIAIVCSLVLAEIGARLMGKRKHNEQSVPKDHSDIQTD